MIAPNVVTVSPREAYAAYVRGSMLVDVRERNEKISTPDVKQVVVLPMSELSKRFEELPKNRSVVLLSGVGNRGQEAARFLAQHGFDNIAIVEGGARAWAEEGLPTC